LIWTAGHAAVKGGR